MLNAQEINRLEKNNSILKQFLDFISMDENNS